MLAVESLPYQYDQRGDVAAQTVQFMTLKERPVFKTATVYAFKGALSDGILLELQDIWSIPLNHASPRPTSQKPLKCKRIRRQMLK